MPMPAPATTLDEVYSDPAATAVEWEETRRVLETAELFWVSTVRADEQKCVNLRSNPHVVLTTGCNRWDGGIDVVVEGDAVRVTDDAFRGSDGSGEALVFSVTPVKVFAHAKGDPFGATTHKFASITRL
jgi:hypothetical protein